MTLSQDSDQFDTYSDEQPNVRGQGRTIMRESDKSMSESAGWWKDFSLSKCSGTWGMAAISSAVHMGVIVGLFWTNRNRRREIASVRDQVLYHQAVLDSWARPEDDDEGSEVHPGGLVRQRSYYYHPAVAK